MAQQELEVISSEGNPLQKVYLEPVRNAGASRSVFINNVTLNIFLSQPVIKKKVVVKRIRFRTTERAFNENGRLFAATLILSATAGLLIASL